MSILPTGPILRAFLQHYLSQVCPSHLQMSVFLARLVDYLNVLPLSVHSFSSNFFMASLTV